MDNPQEKLNQLINDGFCVFENILDADMLARVRAASDGLLAAQSADHFEAQKSTGSMISLYDDPFFAELVAYEPALAALAVLGYPKPRWVSGFVISKPPQSPPLFWHQDWWGWNDPISYSDAPQQLALMYYMVDTSKYNGCLRIIKGSHRRRHPMHDAASDIDTLLRATDPTHPAFRPLPDDVAVPVKVGDLVIGDARVLHGAYSNQSDKWRTVITLFYHPAFDSAPERIRAYLSQKQTLVAAWPEPAQQLVQALVPDYDGPAKPLEATRVPGEALK